MTVIPKEKKTILLSDDFARAAFRLFPKTRFFLHVANVFGVRSFSFTPETSSKMIGEILKTGKLSDIDDIETFINSGNIIELEERSRPVELRLGLDKNEKRYAEISYW